MTKPTLPFLLSLFFLPGCGTLPGGGRWGGDATLTPGWERVRDSAVRAAKSPRVWVPVAAAAALQVNDWDGSISDWATDHHPVFGSRSGASDWSDGLRNAAYFAYAATALAAPGAEAGGDWWLAKGKGAAVGLSALGLTGAATGGLKDATNRERPDGSNDRSFPSAHTSAAAVSAMLASRNLEHLDLSPAAQTGLQIGVGALPYATGWARVESAVHYPADILFGTALGNFVGAVINDAFLGIEPGAPTSLYLQPAPGGGVLAGVSWAF